MKRFGIIFLFLGIFGVARWLAVSQAPLPPSPTLRNPSASAELPVQPPSPIQRKMAPRPEGTSAIAQEMRRGRHVVRALSSTKSASVPRTLDELAKRGKGFQMEGISYRWIPELRTVSLDEFRPTDGTPMEIRGNQMIFQTEAESDRGTSNVVYNSATRSLGLVTGALSVKWSHSPLSDALARDYQLSPVQSFDHLGITFYKTGITEMPVLLALYNRLKYDGRLSDVSLQVVEHFLRTQ